MFVSSVLGIGRYMEHYGRPFRLDRVVRESLNCALLSVVIEGALAEPCMPVHTLVFIGLHLF